MAEWEYRKIDLNNLPRKAEEIDSLNDAGEDGWELVAILANNVAYLKRQADDRISETIEKTAGAVLRSEDADGAGNGAGPGRGYEAKVKYRDPKTNETWAGRGRMASWLKSKQDAGEDIDDYLV